MKSAKIHREVIAPHSASMRRLQCRHRRSSSPAGSGRTVTDDSGSLAITVWSCALCGDLVEEIHLLSRGGKSQPYPIRYAVAPQPVIGGQASVSISR
jgi:hypothetical protein